LFEQLFKIGKILLLLHAKLVEVVEETGIFPGSETLELGKVATPRCGRSDTCLQSTSVLAEIWTSMSTRYT
jgi:hypothetical protein